MIDTEAEALTAARMSSADLVHLKGLGSSLCFSMKARMSASRVEVARHECQLGEPAFNPIQDAKSA